MTIYKRVIFILILAVSCFMAACTPSTSLIGEPRTWIDVPINDLEVASGQPVQIEGHAAHTAGVDHIEFWFDGALQMTLDDPATEGNLAYFSQSWTPPGDGDHTIQVVAIGTDGSGSQPDTVRIHVGSQVAEVTEAPAATLVPSISPSPTVDVPPLVVTTPAPDEATTPPPSPPVIQFYGNPEVVDAGLCTTLNWHVQNAQSVAYDGASVGPDGYSNTFCPCAPETHTLTVTGLDGSVETRTVTITVNGSCAPVDPPAEPPAPPVDSDPPAAPVQMKPINGQEFDCIGGLMLRWQPASDPSGIAEYRLQVEYHFGDNNWQPVPGASRNGLTVTEFELRADTDPMMLVCGGTYRWRVLAVDGAGNVGPWSGWFLFTVLIF